MAQFACGHADFCRNGEARVQAYSQRAADEAEVHGVAGFGKAEMGTEGRGTERGAQ